MVGTLLFTRKVGTISIAPPMATTVKLNTSMVIGFFSIQRCQYSFAWLTGFSSGAASAASLAMKLPCLIVLYKLYTIINAPSRYNEPPMLRVTYMGIIWVTVSRNWNFN